MDRVTGRKQVPTIADRPLCLHTKHYERFFLLCVDLKVNGQSAKLSGVDSRRMLLSVSKQGSWQVSSEHFLSAVNEAGKKHGIGQLGRLRCGQLPMMEVDFASSKDIEEFLKSLSESKFQKCLELKLQEQIHPKPNSVSLDVSLHLVVPLPDRDASLTVVTLENLKSCLQSLNEGNGFDYRKVTSKDRVVPYRKGSTILTLLLFLHCHFVTFTERYTCK